MLKALLYFYKICCANWRRQKIWDFLPPCAGLQISSSAWRQKKSEALISFMTALSGLRSPTGDLWFGHFAHRFGYVPRGRYWPPKYSGPLGKAWRPFLAKYLGSATPLDRSGSETAYGCFLICLEFYLQRWPELRWPEGHLRSGSATSSDDSSRRPHWLWFAQSEDRRSSSFAEPIRPPRGRITSELPNLAGGQIRQHPQDSATPLRHP